MPTRIKLLTRPDLDPRFDQPGQTTCVTLAEAGAVLRTRRREMGWSQDLAAEVCGFNQHMISEIERGTRKVAFDRVALYANRLGVDIVLTIPGKLS